MAFSAKWYLTLLWIFAITATDSPRPDGDGRIGSSSNDDGDSNENNGKKAISSHDYDVKVPISRFFENSGTQDNNFPELWYSLLDFNSKKILPTFDKLNNME